MKGRKSRNPELSQFLAFVVLLMYLVVLTMVSGCGKSQVSDAPTTFKVEWAFSQPPENWNAGSPIMDPRTGKGPVYRLIVRPTVAPLNYDWLALQCSIWTDEGVIIRQLGNVALGPPSSLNGKEIALDLGGNLSSSNRRFNIVVTGRLPGGFDTTTPPSYFNFTPTAVTKTLTVEYDHQTTYNVFVDAGSAGLFVNNAFGPAGKQLSFMTDDVVFDTTILPCILDNCDIGFINFVSEHKDEGKNLYLAAVKNSAFNENNPNTGKAGLSRAIPDLDAGSMIFSGHVSYMVGSTPHRTRLVSWVLTHELGHQNVFISHPQDSGGATKKYHDSPFCVMNDNISFAGDNDSSSTNDPPGIERIFFYNPFFCNADIAKIKSAVP